jgi:hypothetical protein
MRLRFLVLTAALALTNLAAHSQVGLYFNPIVTRASNSTPDSGPFAFLGQNGTSRVFGGVDFGGYYVFSHQQKFDASVDVREAIQHGDSASLANFLVGVRLAATPLAYGLKPYGQLSIGAGRTSSGLNPAHIERFAYMLYGGVDKPIAKHVDFRVIEIGYGSLSTISSADYYGPEPIPAAHLVSFSTGLVFRIP